MVPCLEINAWRVAEWAIRSETDSGPRFRVEGGIRWGNPLHRPVQSLIVSVESVCADLLICVNLRNSDRRRRQYPAARSIGLYWESEMVSVS